MNAASLKEALRFVERETHLRTKSYRMLSDGSQGELLQAFSLMIRPRAILELGTFTGYATLCLSRGLADDGVVDTVEIDDEMEDIFLEAFRIAGLKQARSHIGDLKEVIPMLERSYDIVYIDANKREYPLYYDLVFDKVVPGGYILADNVLWNGRAKAGSVPKDPQTRAIIEFNEKAASDPRVEAVMLPIRDGLYVIRKKI